MTSLSGSLTLQAGPTPPLLVEPELLALLVDPEELALLVEPELLALLVEPELEPVSGVAESSAPASADATVFGGSFTLFSSGGGSADFVSSTVAPRSSWGDVAHAEIRARTESAPTAMRLERRMPGTVAAELCGLLERPPRETR
jgi:hypothetical protein